MPNVAFSSAFGSAYNSVWSAAIGGVRRLALRVVFIVNVVNRWSRTLRQVRPTDL